MRTDTDIFEIDRFGWPPDLQLCANLSATEWLNMMPAYCRAEAIVSSENSSRAAMPAMCD